MSKPTRGATKVAPGKKKAKRRPEPGPMTQVAPTSVSGEAVQAEENGNGAVSAPVLQFRPRAVGAAPVRAVAPKGTPAKTVGFPVVDYSYVYTDLKIIAVLVCSLLVALIALAFVIR